MSYTPGPWIYEYNNADDSGGGQWYEIFAKGRNDAQLLWFPYNSTADREAEALANARLIAAAPELVEALQDILNRCVAGSNDFDGAIRSMNPTQDGHALIAARALLKRIKGE